MPGKCGPCSQYPAQGFLLEILTADHKMLFLLTKLECADMLSQWRLWYYAIIGFLVQAVLAGCIFFVPLIIDCMFTGTLSSLRRAWLSFLRCYINTKTWEESSRATASKSNTRVFAKSWTTAKARSVAALLPLFSTCNHVEAMGKVLTSVCLQESSMDKHPQRR